MSEWANYCKKHPFEWYNIFLLFISVWDFYVVIKSNTHLVVGKNQSFLGQTTIKITTLFSSVPIFKTHELKLISTAKFYCITFLMRFPKFFFSWPNSFLLFILTTFRGWILCFSAGFFQATIGFGWYFLLTDIFAFRLWAITLSISFSWGSSSLFRIITLNWC